ncbi:BTAD domain-containing putative transcriptional regulator [Streptomyces sp. B3I8]|uniref:AfsR/SARP family transcriptional regulator n=1 Tax=Streptomyces sp. B3I8 TaxID=3042303 RepID=UPI0027888B91|nr:BTAD domain-containing putative transcriptional regulator [Streptomyces sp. B3I8]MDQ0786701.1 DNA-binding SARP family transcriptional activator/Tfp pilus assembly protein PilF [Streptomyces sp. B3I8]
MRLKFAVLGPVRAWRDDAELTLGSPKQRALLALLLTQANQPVPVHEIVDVLWGQGPPDSAVNVVQRHIGQLRRLLEPDLPVRGTSRWLVRGSGGYRLEADTADLDLLRFRALRQRARQAANEGEPAEAAELLIEALQLWRGPTASGVTPEIRSHPNFAAVDGEHLAAVKEAAQRTLEAGPDVGVRVLTTLRQAAANHPLDEVLQARLIQVLAATGHQAEALDVYQTVRARLVDDLGLDAGPELLSAQQQVLQQTVTTTASIAAPKVTVSGTNDTGFRSSTASSGHATTAFGVNTGDSGGNALEPVEKSSARRSATAETVRPAQLPADLPTFTGRFGELASLSDPRTAEDERAPTSLIRVIGGMAGVGKTALAVHWAHRVAEQFPDGQLFIDLRGFHPSGSIMKPSEAIRSFLDALGVPADRIPAGLDAQSALYRSLLADRRILIVLDNARDTEHVRPLLPGAAGCLAIVTSRNHLYGLVAGDGAYSITLDALNDADSLQLLSRRLGRDRVVEEAEAAADIVEACGHLPLALAIVSARAAMNPTFTLTSIAGELLEDRGSLDAFSGEAPVADARSAFFWSYSLVTPEAARVFRLLGLHPGADCSLAAVASLAGQEPRQIRSALTELVRASLVFESMPGRFSCHELLRTYGAELAHAQGTADEARAARHRMFDHYLHTAHAADSILAPKWERISLRPVAADVTVSQLSDQVGAVDWLQTNRPALFAVIEEDARRGHGRYAWQLATLMERYLDRNGRWEEQLLVQSTAATAAQRLGNVRGQAHAHRALGFVHGRMERWEEADAHLARALRLYQEVADFSGQGRVHRYLAFLANHRKRYDVALEHYRQAGMLYRVAHRPSGEASVLNELGWTYILMDRYGDALEQCHRAVALHREIGDRNGEAAALDSVGYAYYHLHKYSEALASYEHALRLYREISDLYLEADTLVHIGDTHQAAGRHARAVFVWHQALGILDAIGHPDAAGVRERVDSYGADRDAGAEPLDA